MQLRLIPGFLLFLGSYLPLAVILAIQDVSKSVWGSGICQQFPDCKYNIFDHPILSIGIISITLLCFIFTLLTLNLMRFKYSINVIEAKHIPNEIISYSFPYVVSFMGVDYSSIGKIIGLATFLFWLFVITYKAGQILMNPLLVVFGWNLYEAKVRINGYERIEKILSKGYLMPGNHNYHKIQETFICQGEIDE